MAYLINNYDDKFGGTHPNCYVKIIQLDIHYQARIVYIHLGFFKDEEARKNNKVPVFKKMVQYSEKEFDMFLGFMANHNNPTLHTMYTLIGKVVPELSDAVQVVEKEKYPEEGEEAAELSMEVLAEIEKLAKWYQETEGMGKEEAYQRAEKEVLDRKREEVEEKVKEDPKEGEIYNGLEDIIDDKFLSDGAAEEKAKK
jgi:hypothetical protein